MLDDLADDDLGVVVALLWPALELARGIEDARDGGCAERAKQRQLERALRVPRELLCEDQKRDALMIQCRVQPMISVRASDMLQRLAIRELRVQVRRFPAYKTRGSRPARAPLPGPAGPVRPLLRTVSHVELEVSAIYGRFFAIEGANENAVLR
jgi:hypothetical protein